MYGAVLVCLVLLCVLLLTFIIVLRVQLNAETHQHQMDRETFANMLDQVQNNNTILMGEIILLLKNKTELEKERDKLQNEKTVLAYNVTQLQSTITFLKNERDQKTNQSITNTTITTTWI